LARLGRQAQARVIRKNAKLTVDEVEKVPCSPKSPPGNSDGGACNALKSTLSPAMGATCGRRERRTDAGKRVADKEEQSSPALELES
jgi:hypothetical protein